MNHKVIRTKRTQRPEVESFLNVCARIAARVLAEGATLQPQPSALRVLPADLPKAA